ncbi:MAG: four helix bundle protein [Planctomycetota bacterium]|nr:four helix bundle protein [Planctomycetota bacterium]
MPSRFVHHRLHAFQVALELVRGIHDLTARFERGHAGLRDQLRRASASVVRHIAEAVNRTSARDRIHRFTIARGECGECDASLEIAKAIGAADAYEIARLQGLADRVSAMLTGLMRKEGERL